MKYIFGLIAIIITGCGKAGTRSLPHDILNNTEPSVAEMTEYSKVYGSTTVEDCKTKLDKDLYSIMETGDGLSSKGQTNVDALKKELTSSDIQMFVEKLSSTMCPAMVSLYTEQVKQDQI